MEDAIDDSDALRKFVEIDFLIEQSLVATTLLYFCHLLKKRLLGRAMFDWDQTSDG